jgi:hypothetical protein
MDVAKKGLAPREGMRLWYGRELELFQQGRAGVNEYACYAPAEAREEVRRLTSDGTMPWLGESHFALWEALLDVMGWETFEEPLGLPPGEAVRRLIGNPLLINRIPKGNDDGHVSGCF